MNKYIITIVETNVFDVEVEAESLDEAKDLAFMSPDLWVKDEFACSTDFGDDHFILNNDEWSRI